MISIALASGRTTLRPEVFAVDSARNRGYQAPVPKSLLERVADGDGMAMQECIDMYAGLVWRLAYRMLSDPSEAEDAVQEVFVSIWENCGRHNPEIGSEITFIAMIARRRLIDRGRRLRHRKNTEAAAREMTPREPMGSGGPSGEPSGVDDESFGKVLAALEALPDSQRTAVTLSVRSGLTHEQISRQTGMPLGTVKTNIRRGLLRIRGLLAADAAEGDAGAAEESGQTA